MSRALGFALIVCGALLASATAHACAERLANDPRFAWADWPDIERKPPDLFPSQMAALLSLHMERLPAGLSDGEHAFYGGVFRLLRDYARVQTLIDDVVTHVHGDETLLLAEMASLEQHFGFRVLEVHGALHARDWMDLVAQGYTFIDHADARVRLSLGPGLEAREGHWLHGELSHRFQLHLVLKDVLARPEFYGSPTAANVLSYYSRLGDRAWARRLDWQPTGLLEDGVARAPLGLFFHLFDSAENNASSPGFFYEYRAYWPGLPLR